jgi:DNA-binding winged helix-turn-helix (wHTH) protein
MAEFGCFGILADGRPIRLGGSAFDVLMALIEASGAVVGKDELSSRVRRGRIVDENRQSGTRSPRCAKALAPTAR